jgi:7,8-dihydroneopterin 2',3'-cyclic phosphate phosphodiesterase
MLEDPSVEVNGNTYRGIPLEDSPASIRHHHNYPGGFVEHTLAMTDLSLALCDIVENVYQCAVDRDLVLCGALLHDIFKPVTYAEDNGRYKRSPIAERIDHLSLATAELIRRRFPLEAVHVIVASHGSEHGPIGPQTIEALICHLADWTDAKLNGDVLNGARWIVREVIGEDLPHLTGELAFKIIRSKTDSGLGKVRELLEQRNLIPTKNNS